MDSGVDMAVLVLQQELERCGGNDGEATAAAFHRVRVLVELGTELRTKWQGEEEG